MDFKKAKADHISFIILFATIGLLPIFSLPFLGVAGEMSKSALLALGVALSLVAWIWGGFQEKKISFPRSLVLAAALVLAGVMTAAALASDTIGAAFWGTGLEVGTAGMMLVLLVLLFLCTIHFQDKKRVLWLALVLGGGFALAALLQIGHLVFASAPIFQNIAPTANVIGKWNDFALFSGLTALVALFVLHYRTVSRRMKIAISTLLASALFFMLLANFLAVWIIFGLAAIAICIQSMQARKKLLKKEARVAGKPPFPLLPCLLGGFTILFIAGNAFVGSFLPTHLHALSLEVRPSFGSTLSVITQSFRHDPLFGIGPNAFSNAWSMYKPASVLTSQFWNTDFTAGFGTVPTYFVTAGLLGGLAWLLLLAAFAYQAVTARIQTIKDADTRLLIGSAIIAAAYLWIMMIVYVPNVTIVALLFAMMGILVALLAGKKVIPLFSFSFDALSSGKTILIRSAGVLAMLAILAISMVSFRQLAAAGHYNRALGAESLDGAISHLSRAVEIRPTDLYYRSFAKMEMQQAEDLLTANASAIDTVKARVIELFASAEENALRATEYDKNKYLNWLVLGDFYRTVAPLGAPDAYLKAETAYQKMLFVAGPNPAVHVPFAYLNLSRGMVEEAKAHLGYALSLKPDYTEVSFLLAKIDRDAGDLAGAIAEIEKAAELNPSSFAAFFNLGILKYDHDDYTGAADAFEHAVLLDPENLDARYFLGLSYDRAGRKQDAITQFELILKTNPDNQEIKEGIARMKAGKNVLEKDSAQ